MSVVMIGATGAVGSCVAAALARDPAVTQLTTLGRRPVPNLQGSAVWQHTVDAFDPISYQAHLAGHQVAICTLGVGEPSKVSRDELVRVDKTAVLAFATACKQSGIDHFQLLSAVGANAKSSSHYLRVKGELEAALRSLAFSRLSVFQPSMILTPKNRYGLLQGIMLATWPIVSIGLIGPLKKFRGIEVDRLGRAIAANATRAGAGNEILQWNEIVRLAAAA